MQSIAFKVLSRLIEELNIKRYVYRHYAGLIPENKNSNVKVVLIGLLPRAMDLLKMNSMDMLKPNNETKRELAINILYFLREYLNNPLTQLHFIHLINDGYSTIADVYTLAGDDIFIKQLVITTVRALIGNET